MQAKLQMFAAMLQSMLLIRSATPLDEHANPVDMPAGHRLHGRHIPLVGGLGIFTALAIVLGIAAPRQPFDADAYRAMVLGAALLVALPLFETTAMLVRRMCLGHSQVRTRRTHLHQLLLDAGFTANQAVFSIAGLQILLGATGLAGWYLGVAEYAMFGGFFALLLVHQFAVSVPWRLVPALRRLHQLLGLPIAGASKIFVGNLPLRNPERMLHAHLGGLLDDYRYELYRRSEPGTDQGHVYAVIHIGSETQVNAMIREIKRKRLPPKPYLVVRHYVPRNNRNERRMAHYPIKVEQRQNDRRIGGYNRIAGQSS